VLRLDPSTGLVERALARQADVNEIGHRGQEVPAAGADRPDRKAVGNGTQASMVRQHGLEPWRRTALLVDGRARQWLDAVRAAGVWAACRCLRQLPYFQACATADTRAN
jgi:hypothetical protein